MRRENARLYNSLLCNVDEIFIPKLVSSIESHIFHQYTIIIKNKFKRDKLRNYLLENGISTMVYYPRPLQKEQPYRSFKSLNNTSSEKIAKRVLSLPIHPLLTKKDVKKVSDTIIKFFNSYFMP